MRELKHGDSVVVYHEIEEGEHCYYFCDGGRRIDLDWGETGHVPNATDRFPHPEVDIDLRLDDILPVDGYTPQTRRNFK